MSLTLPTNFSPDFAEAKEERGRKMIGTKATRQNPLNANAEDVRLILSKPTLASGEKTESFFFLLVRAAVIELPSELYLLYSNNHNYIIV